MSKPPQKDKGAMAASLPIILAKGQGSKCDGRQSNQGLAADDGRTNGVDESREVFHL